MELQTMPDQILSSRPVEAADIPTICSFPANLEEVSFMFPNAGYPLQQDVLEDSIRNRHASTVVLLNDAVAGFANFYDCKAGDSCSIGNVIVDPELRGKGIARFLVETMFGVAAHVFRAKRVELVCFNSNVGGLLLYAKLGFAPYAIERRTNSQGERVAAIRMRRAL
jgi:ribosomal protein S18 acetylase RimI-like enzyme